MISNKIRLRYKIYIAVCLVLILTVLGSVFGLTLAYLNGRLDKSSQTPNPYVEAALYYVDGQSNQIILEENSITGSIDASGNVSLSVKDTSISKDASNNFALPIYVKKTGNINAYVISVLVDIEFYDGSTLAPAVSISSGLDSYYLTFVAPNTYTIDFNSFYSFTSDVLLAPNASGSQILTSLNCAVAEDIAFSQLINKNFKVKFIVEIGQEGIEDLV